MIKLRDYTVHEMTVSTDFIFDFVFQLNALLVYYRIEKTPFLHETLLFS